MIQYLNAMNKYEPAFTYNGTALQGWQSAALLAQAVKLAGNNLTQANIISITNHITDFTAGGLTTVTNWENSHTKTTYPTCSAFVKVKGKKFVPGLREGQGGLRLRGAEREEHDGGRRARRHPGDMTRASAGLG